VVGRGLFKSKIPELEKQTSECLVNGSFTSQSLEAKPRVPRFSRSKTQQQQTQQSTILVATSLVVTPIMSSASDSSPTQETTFRRVMEGGSEKVDNVIVVGEKSTCEAEKVLVDNCNRLSALYTLCIGLETTTNDGATKPLLDFEDSIFKNLKKKDLKPSVDFLREEVTRRSFIEGSVQKIPKPKGWTFSKCLQFLVQHPITGADEIAFLKKKVQEVLEVVNEASKADDEEYGKNGWDHCPIYV
jgi:hypothetical protein